MSSVVVSYIPAIHQGYLNYFTSHPGELYLIGRQYVKDAPRMERDIRAVDPSTMAKMINSLKIFTTVGILENDTDIKRILKQEPKLFMPDEDVNHQFASSHLKGVKITFDSTFLRWDRQISTTEFEVPPNRHITRDKLHQDIMNIADNEALKSADWWRQVGAVIWQHNKPIFAGHNRPLTAEDYTVNIFGDPRSNFDAGERIDLVKTIHAEAGIIAEAARTGTSLNGASIYVSTFPCPTCAKLIAAAGIKHVYYDKGYSLLDAEDIFIAHSIEIILVKK